jgi:hypothetical protein
MNLRVLHSGCILRGTSSGHPNLPIVFIIFLLARFPIYALLHCTIKHRPFGSYPVLYNFFFDFLFFFAQIPTFTVIDFFAKTSGAHILFGIGIGIGFACS